MKGSDEDDDSEFGSVTSSQVSILKHSCFAGLSPDRPILPEDSSSGITKSDSGTGSDCTEVLGDQFPSPVVRTPVLSSQDSLFRTPPEEPYISSAADSDPTVRVAVTNCASALVTATGASDSPSSGAVKVRILLATPDSASSSATKDVRVLETEPATVAVDLESRPSGVKTVRDSEATPDSSATVTVRVSGKGPDTATVGTDGGDSLSPSSGAENARVSGNIPASAYPSFLAGNIRVSGINTGHATAAQTGKFGVLEVGGGAANDSDKESTPVSLKDVIEAILRNSGEADRSAEYEKLSIVDILRTRGIHFPD